MGFGLEVAAGQFGFLAGLLLSCAIIAVAFLLLCRSLSAGLLSGLRIMGLGAPSGSDALYALLFSAPLWLLTLLGPGLSVSNLSRDPGLFIQHSALQPLHEELIFRGYLCRTIRGAPWSRCVASSLSFTLLHYLGGTWEAVSIDQILGCSVIFSMGLVQAIGIVMFGWSLWRAIALHAAYNAVGFLMWTKTWEGSEGEWRTWLLGLFLSQIAVLTSLVFQRRHTPQS